MSDVSHSLSTPAEARRTQTIILASLPPGVTLFAAVGCWVTREGPASDPGPLVAIWIVCMALVEGIALFGGVILIMSGVAAPALIGVALTWGALVALWPRREWYGLP